MNKEENLPENVERKEGFSQVCVWPGVYLGNNTPEEFENFILNEFDVRIQYLETIYTNPDRDDSGRPVPNTGGRTDIFFAVHNEDIGRFAVPRLSVGIRWIEDAVAKHNHGEHLYPERVHDYKTWNAEE